MNVNITDPIFHDEAKALRTLESDRWPDGEPVCPFCESTGVTRMGGKTQAACSSATCVARSSPFEPER